MGTRHEEAAAFAAGAEAHLTGKLAVCAGSCGPSNLHLVNGLFDCQRNHVPVLAIAAHIPSSEIGSGCFQETHPRELFRECSVYRELVANPDQMPRVLEIAARTAILKKGAAAVVLPGDAAPRPMPEGAEVSWSEPALPVVRPPEAEVDKLADLLNVGKRIAVLAGARRAGAHDEVVELARVSRAPVVHASRGKEFVEWDNPYDVGMTGLIGFSFGYHAMEATDTPPVPAPFPRRWARGGSTSGRPNRGRPCSTFRPPSGNWPCRPRSRWSTRAASACT